MYLNTSKINKIMIFECFIIILLFLNHKGSFNNIKFTSISTAGCTYLENQYGRMYWLNCLRNVALSSATSGTMSRRPARFSFSNRSPSDPPMPIPAPVSPVWLYSSVAKILSQ